MILHVRQLLTINMSWLLLYFQSWESNAALTSTQSRLDGILNAALYFKDKCLSVVSWHKNEVKKTSECVTLILHLSYLVWSQPSFWFVLRCDWLAGLSALLFQIWKQWSTCFGQGEKKQTNKSLQWMAFSSDWWMRWENILTCMTHRVGIFKKVQNTLNSWGGNDFRGCTPLHSGLSQTTIFSCLLLLCNKINFQMSSCFAKSNISQYLAIFHELQVVTTVLLGHTEKPWRTQLGPQTPWDTAFKH